MKPALGLRPFVDTNVLLYLIGDDRAKAAVAEAVLRIRVVISVQVLNEFANIARRKHKLSWPLLDGTLEDLRHFADVRAVDLATHERGLLLAQRYQLSIYDAMIAAAALEAGCTTLLSEDFQTGQVFDQQLTVRNPFL